MRREMRSTSWYFAFRGSELLVFVGDESVAVPDDVLMEALRLAPVSRHLVGELDGHSCYSLELPADFAAPPGTEFRGLRALYGQIPHPLHKVAGRAVQLVEWDRTHRFCGRCGTPTVLRESVGAKECPSCGYLAFPRVSPAIIVLIRDGERTLLARDHRFPPGQYSTLAGFVEPGESLEEAVLREVAEEVGVRVKNIRYFGSQPWPYPHQLMIGFTADYDGGEIRIQEEEIADAQWFTAANLPKLPPPMSIARQLIDAFVAERMGKQ